MNFEPQKLFIGLVDFFSVWLPGALLTFIVSVWYHLLSPEQATAADWVVFLFASYLVGHFVFLIGSRLDSPIYDRLRHATRHHQIDRLAKGGHLSSRLARAFARRTFSKFDPALQQAVRMRDEHLDPLGASQAINAFQWCKVKLALEHPAALAEVERFEADSKFFRSFCVILALLALWAAGALIAYAAGFLDEFRIDRWRSAGLVAAGLVIFWLALWRYVERRNRATTQAYWLVLGTARPKAAPRWPRMAAPKDPAQAADPTHAGGVVLRRRLFRPVEYLRIRAKDGAQQWVLPKGHIEPGEGWQKTAVREVLEEAAVWARVHDDLRHKIEFEKDGKPVRVQVFLMEFLGTDSFELPQWLSWLGRWRSWRPRWLFWLPAKPKQDSPRERDWAKLSKVKDLPEESRRAVQKAAAYLGMAVPPDPIPERTAAQAGSSASAGTVSSIQPPPSSRSPS